MEWGSSGGFEFDIVIVALFLPLILSGVADRIFLEGQSKQQQLKNAESERLLLAAKYEALKARLSPHFLFNSLNTLADIIEEDPKLAVRFIEQMSEIYRYILEHRDCTTVSLSKEIASVEALVFVLEARHPDAIDVLIDLTAEQAAREVVPLTVQTLLENALKHNHYTKKAPLQVRIYSDEGRLIVENKVNKRQATASTGFGLESLMKRVKQVCKDPIEIVEAPDFFQVRVPTLAPEQRNDT